MKSSCERCGDRKFLLIGGTVNDCVRCPDCGPQPEQLDLIGDDTPEGVASRFPMARRDDPDTSKETAAVVAANLGKIQVRVIQVFGKYGPMTARVAEKLDEVSDYGFSTIRKRISELYRDGKLVTVGIDRTKKSPAMIYALPEQKEDS